MADNERVNNNCKCEEIARRMIKTTENESFAMQTIKELKKELKEYKIMSVVFGLAWAVTLLFTILTQI